MVDSQKRNTFRVTFPQAIFSAHFKLSSLNGNQDTTEFKMVDLSAEGMGLSIPVLEGGRYKIGTVFVGTIAVGKHPEFEVEAFLKHIKTLPMECVLGCEFKKMPEAINQKIAFIVNDTHRQIISRQL